MSKRYPGNFITGNPVALSQTSNNGVWDLKDNYHATTAGTWQEADGVYEIPRSLRFRGSSYMSRTPAVSGNGKTFTVAAWVKRTTSAVNQRIFSAGTTQGYNGWTLAFSNDQILLLDDESNFAGDYVWTTPNYYRDFSAWMHVVLAYDTTQQVPADRCKLYVNGSEVSFTGTGAAGGWSPTAQNYTTYVNQSGYNQQWGARGAPYTDSMLEGCMADCYMIDGKALDASHFGYFDPITNIWQPKQYTGSYGTNGCYLSFRDNSSLANLGRNFAGSNYQTNSVTPEGLYQATANTTSTIGAYGETVTVSQIIPNNALANGNPFTSVWNNGSFSTTTGSLYTFSALVKPLVFPLNFQLYDNGTGAGGGTQYTFTDANTYFETQGALATSSITKLSNGWYRLSTTIPYPSSGHYKQIYSGAHPTGNGSTPHYQIYGVQVNLGTGADPIIHTSGTAANNDWSPNNFSLTSGYTYDSLVDSPTNIPNRLTDIGGVVVGNYPVIARQDGGGTMSEGGLRVTGEGDAMSSMICAKGGKWYCEVYIWALGTNLHLGWSKSRNYGSTHARADDGRIVYQWQGGVYFDNTGIGSTVTGLATWGVGDVIGMAIDTVNGIITFYKNGVSVYTRTSSVISIEEWKFLVYCSTSGDSATINYGQRPFAYAPPSGYQSLNTTNIAALGTSTVGVAAITPHKWMDAVQYTGQATDLKVTNSGKFQPDLVWIKTINAATSHELYDSARGVGLRQETNASNVDWNGAGGALTAFNPDGFTVPNSANYGNNGNGYQFDAAMWKQSPTAGFNVITYTGNASGAARAISHNLGTTPGFIITKSRDTEITGTNYWNVHHSAFNAGDCAQLNVTTAKFNSANYWGNTLPTSSNFYVGGSSSNVHNENGNRYVAYVWAEVPGYSKFGYYIGNGSDNGPFVNLGFRPRWIMIKNISYNGEQWAIIDTARYRYNDNTAHILFANATSIEDLNASYHQIDILSNGFKVRAPSQQLINYSGHYFIYAAFAESPFALNNRAR